MVVIPFLCKGVLFLSYKCHPLSFSPIKFKQIFVLIFEINRLSHSDSKKLDHFTMFWCNGPVEGGTLSLRVDDGTSGRNVDNDALSSEWPVDAALLVS